MLLDTAGITAEDEAAQCELAPEGLTELIVRYADKAASEEEVEQLNDFLIHSESACELFVLTFLQISVASKNVRDVDFIPQSGRMASQFSSTVSAS